MFVLEKKITYVVKDLKEEETHINISYRRRLFVGEDPHRLVATGRLYPRGLTIHIVLIHDDSNRVVVEEVRYASVLVLVPIIEVHLVGKALGTFLA